MEYNWLWLNRDDYKVCFNYKCKIVFKNVIAHNRNNDTYLLLSCHKYN